MEQLNIFDYIEKKPDINVVVQKASEKPVRSEQYEILDNELIVIDEDERFKE